MSAHVSVSTYFMRGSGLKTQLVLRTCKSEDIDSVVRYFETEKSDFFEAIGIDLRYLPATAEIREDLKSLCADLDRAALLTDFAKDASRVPLVFSLDSRLIGHLVITQEQDQLTGLQAWFAHSHIWNLSDRSRGLGAAVVPLMIEFIEKYLPIQRLILEMSSENIAMIRVLEKEMSARERLFIRVSDYDRPAKGIARAMRVARFEIEI